MCFFPGNNNKINKLLLNKKIIRMLIGQLKKKEI